MAYGSFSLFYKSLDLGISAYVMYKRSVKLFSGDLAFLVMFTPKSV